MRRVIGALCRKGAAYLVLNRLRHAIRKCSLILSGRTACRTESEAFHLSWDPGFMEARTYAFSTSSPPAGWMVCNDAGAGGRRGWLISSSLGLPSLYVTASYAETQECLRGAPATETESRLLRLGFDKHPMERDRWAVRLDAIGRSGWEGDDDPTGQESC